MSDTKEKKPKPAYKKRQHILAYLVESNPANKLERTANEFYIAPSTVKMYAISALRALLFLYADKEGTITKTCPIKYFHGRNVFAYGHTGDGINFDDLVGEYDNIRQLMNATGWNVDYLNPLFHPSTQIRNVAQAEHFRSLGLMKEEDDGIMEDTETFADTGFVISEPSDPIQYEVHADETSSPDVEPDEQAYAVYDMTGHVFKLVFQGRVKAITMTEDEEGSTTVEVQYR